MTLLDGAAFALDAPARVPAVWGTGSRVLWPQGEPTLLCGPDGVGKTTLAQQLVLARAGIRLPRLLALPVAPDLGRKVLYIASDRPRQAARSLRRMVREEDREQLRDRLVVWRGAPPFDLRAQPEALPAFAREHAAGTVVIDGLPDLGLSLSNEDDAKAIKAGMQLCVEEGIEMLALGHNRKAQGENKKPKKLADVFGSRVIVGGCGSVILLWGEAGDPEVELSHLKQPADEVGPLTLLHDNHAGSTSVVVEGGDVVTLLGGCTTALSARDVAERLYGSSERKDMAKAKRKLEAAVRDGHLRRLDPNPGEPALWIAVEGVHTEGAHGVHTGVHAEGAQPDPLKRGPVHPRHAEGAHDPHANGNGDLSDGWTDEQLQTLMDSEAHALIEREDEVG